MASYIFSRWEYTLHVYQFVAHSIRYGNWGWKVITDKCWIIFIQAERIICRSRGHRLFPTTSHPPSLSLFASRRISLTLTLLRCHSKWAYRQLEGSRHWKLHIAGVFITLALTFTQMGQQSSFVFIFYQLGSLALHLSLPSWWLWWFVIFRGPSRSSTHFALMDQLPSPTQRHGTQTM